jgi:rubrerythrin
MARPFKSLTEREILALAITLEEEHSRIYSDIAERLKTAYPDSAKIFIDMKAEEQEHHHLLLQMYQSKFGDHIPLIRRHDVKGFVARTPIWLIKNFGVDRMRKLAASMELETRLFYERAATRASDLTIRQLLLDLAEAERAHVTAAEESEQKHLPEVVRAQEDTAKRRLFLLQIIQPGLAGLMDGSVSTLAPLFAAAFAAEKLSQYDSWLPFKVGLAASIGAGISMGFAEALSDDGSLTGRGRPLIRGVACGLMTAAGGLGHTFPFLIPHFRLALWLAIAVVAVELAVISWIRHRFMESPWLIAALQVVLGGIIVLLAGILIGS